MTRRDVAEKAGVTETIVSYVVNGNRYVEKSKKEAVEKAVKELGYQPSPFARALKGKGTNSILFIADDLSSEYFSGIIDRMEGIANDRNCIISLCSDRHDRSFLNTILTRSFDGIVIGSRSMDDSVIQTIIDSGIPVVILEMRSHELKGVYGSINSGLYEGTAEAIGTLVAKKKKKIVYIDSLSVDGKGVDPRDFRYRGYLKGMEDAGLAPFVIEGVESEEELAIRVMECYKDHPFDAAFCRTDNIACAVMKSLHEEEISIPEDVAIIGCNNSRLCRYVFPQLTSLNIRRDLIGEHAMSMLERLKEGKVTEPITIQLKTEYVERESV